MPSGIGDELLVVLSLPIDGQPHPAGVIGIAEDLGALEPCSLLFSAPLVEKVFRN
jgi:hypothetical protein